MRIFLSLACLVVAVGLASAQGRRVHKFMAGHATSKCLDVQGARAGDGARVQIWACNSTAAQKWYVRDVGSGLVELVSALDEKYCLDATGASSKGGTPLQLWSCHGGPNQRWRLRFANGTTQITSAMEGGRCVDVVGVGRDDGTGLQLWDCHGGTNQKWYQD
jgi:hypothetical protein